MFSKKNKIIITTIFMCVLSACADKTSSVNSGNSADTQIINRMTQEYQVNELVVPEILKPEGNYILQQGAFCDNKAYFQVLNNKTNMLYPTQGLYVYHTDTQQLDEIKSYEDNEEIRVIDFRMIGSDLYEIQVKMNQDMVECDIVLNGEIIQTNYLTHPLQAPYFTNVNGKLQYLIPNIENDKRTLSLYELDGKEIVKLYSEDINMSPNKTLPGRKLDVGTILQNSNYLLSYAVNEDEKEWLYVYDGKKVKKIDIDGRVFNTVPLKDGVIVITYTMNEMNQEFEYYWYSHKNEKITPITGEIPTVKNAVHLEDNDFLFSTDERKTAIGKIENNEFVYRIIDEIPNEINFYGNVSNGQDFVFVDIVDNSGPELKNIIQFYTIDWKF